MIKVTHSINGRNVIEGFREIKLVLNESDKVPILDYVPDDIQKKYEKMDFYDEKVIGCFSFDIDQNSIKLNCWESTFFKIIYNKSPRFLAVNAVIDIEDTYTLFHKRPMNVHGYLGWYDQPAGLVLFKDNMLIQEMLLDRLKDRIQKDISLAQEYLTIGEQLPLLIDTEQAISFFYRVTINLPKEKLAKLFQSEIREKNRRPIMPEISQLQVFLDEKKVVFPEAIKYAFPEAFK